MMFLALRQYHNKSSKKWNFRGRAVARRERIFFYLSGCSARLMRQDPVSA